MKKRLLMLLSLYMAITSVGWINAQEIPHPFETNTIDQTDLKAKPGSQPRIGLFANGHAVKIEESGPGKIKISTTDLLKNVSVEMPDSTTIVFGGGYNKTCETTSVTLESGTVYSIVGGGYGTASGSYANSTTTNVHLNGGRVMMFVVGGGAFYSQVGTANIDAKGPNAPTVNSWVLGCIESGAIKDNGKYPEFGAAPCRVDNINLDIQKGTYWIVAIAGGNGHRSFTKVGKAVIKGTEQNPVIIKGGLFGNGSNGRGYSATAEVEYCDLSNKALELASVNRGKLETVDFSFKNCTFSDKIYAYLGATYQWGEGYASSEVGIPQNVKFVFDSSCKNVPVVGISDGLDEANVTLIGAKAKVAPFMKSSTVTNKAFKIGKDKVWNFYNGLITENGATLELHKDNAVLNNMYFANGNAITIEARPNGAGAKIGEEEYDATLQVYGGCYKKNVAKSTNITMNGGTVKNIYGGGYGSNKNETDNLSADVQDVDIKINGGTVSNLVVGGGRYLAKANDVVITVSGEQTSLNNVICGGFDEGKTSNKLETSFEASVNRIANTTFTMTKGTIKGYLFVGGGQGYSYSKTAKAILNGTLLNYGVLGTGSNGRSDNVEVSLTGCTFAKAEKQTDVIEIAALNRGIVNNAMMTFNKCTFPEKAADYYCYLGATYGYDGKSKVELGNVTMTFADCTNTPVVGVSDGLATANVTLTGAKAKLAKFECAKGQYHTEFTIDKGKTWTINDGLELASEADKATLTNNGTLNVASTSIMSAIEVGRALAVNVTSADVVAEMNKASEKKDLKDKTFSIACKDGVIASNEMVAKELLNEGKVVMLLKFADSTYSIASFQKTLAKITNLPDSVVFGTEPIKLAFNLLGTEVSISGTTSDVVALNDGILTIKKPGTVTFDLKVKKDTNGDGKIDDNDKGNENFTYDEDAVNTQVLKVNKRKVTLTAGLTAGDKTYDGNKNITLTKEGSLTFSGKLGTDATGLDLASGFKGELTDANAGEGKEVIVTATLAANGSDSTAFYELAPITFVKAKVTPKDITVTADKKERYYGVENPEFTATTTGLVDGDKLDGILKFTCSATKDSLVKDGGYDIVPYGLTSNNYKIIFEKGKLTVNAVDPVIEMVEAKTVVNGTNRDIQLKARLVNKGGVAADPTVKFTYSANQDVTTELKDGFYTGTISNASAGTFSITASATVSGKTGTSKSIDVTIDEKTPQEISFDKSVMPTMVYGNEMTLSATSPQAAATGEYTYSVAEGGPAKIVDNKLQATGVGKVTLTVTRAADANYSAAVATKTIEITPKPVTVTVGTIEKVYDGTTAINKLPTFTLKGAADGVSVKTTDLKLSFASKNAGESVKVLMPELTLTGTGASNYTLIQPENVTGTIKKAPLTVKVKDVTRMWNQRYTKYEFEAIGLVNDETLSTAYSGEFKVTEEGSELKLEMGTCPNYDITPVPGTLTINKGTPVAVVYGTSGARKTMVVDEAGYTGLNVKLREDGYANILDANGQVIGQSLNKIADTKAALFNASIQTKAADNWNDPKFEEKPYGESYEVAKLDGTWNYESTNANVLTVDATGTNIVCTPVSTGKATILAIGTGEVKILNLEVTPAELTISATDMSKTYDGTTLASGTLTLTGADGKDVALDLSGITFNYADKNAGSKTITPSQPLVLIGSEANNYVLTGSLTGEIRKKEVIVETPLSAYYNGKTVMELTDYASNDRISGDIVPIKVTFDAATVGEHTVNISMGTTGDAANYTLATGQPTKEGNILKSTIVATLPDGASSASNLKSNIKLTVRETGETVTSSDISFAPTISSEVSGGNTVYYVNGGETDNYSVVYDKNQIGFKADQSGDSGSTTVSVSSVSLDKTELTLPRQGTYTLKATINPSDASDKSVTWKSSDESVATVDANGKVTALKVGKATITVTTVDGGKTASCEVTVDFATGLEEALAHTQVYAKQGNIYVNPVQPLQLTIVNMIGKIVYNARISSYAQIPVAKGIYIVRLTNAGNTVVTKVNVY